MFPFYSSVCRLFQTGIKNVPSDVIDTPTLSKTVSKVSLIDNDKIMLLPDNKSSDNLVSVNDVGERVILEYSKFDPLFMHYRPKSKKIKIKYTQ